MVTIGADLHKRTHTVGGGRRDRAASSPRRRVPATPAGHLELLPWAARFPERRWALEDCRHLSPPPGGRPAARRARPWCGCRPSSWPAPAARGREPGKSDPIDALAVARAALREPDLPVARSTAPSASCACSSTTATTWCAERTRDREPAPLAPPRAAPGRGAGRPLARPAPRARRPRGAPRRPSRHRRPHRPRPRGPHPRADAPDRRARARDRRLVAGLAPTLLALQGCGPLTAAKLVGETARHRPLPLARAAFARHNGTAPVPVWSGNIDRHRLTAAATASSMPPSTGSPSPRSRLEGRAYFERRLAAGDTKREAIRALKRRLSDIVFRCMRQDAGLAAPSSVPLGAAA